MRDNVTISEKEFTNKFNQVLEDDPVITTILSKANNTGFTTRLVLDRVKAELKDSIFVEDQVQVEEPASNEDLETEGIEEIEETAPDTNTDVGSDIDDLDELDEEV